ncbi:MAG: transposase [Usitatibacter sp.]
MPVSSPSCRPIMLWGSRPAQPAHAASAAKKMVSETIFRKWCRSRILMYSKCRARRYWLMRPLRHFVPGLPVHLVHRGHNRQHIFRCHGDFLLFRRYLGEAAAEFHVAVHGYVLMSNHVHLLLTPDKGEWDISKAMQSAGRRYVGYFNARYERTGTLWESRFHSSVIQQDRYLLACHRYMDLNPVRARMTASPRDYVWSSHRHYALGQPDSMITPHALVRAMGADDAAREGAYAQLFEAPLATDDLEHIRKAVQGNRALGWHIVGRGRGRPRKMVSDTILGVIPKGTAPRVAATR